MLVLLFAFAANGNPQSSIEWQKAKIWKSTHTRADLWDLERHLEPYISEHLTPYHRCTIRFAIVGCGHMYGSARGRQILQYKINPNPNPNPNTNPSSPYCIMRFIFGSRVHVPSRPSSGLVATYTLRLVYNYI